MRRAQEIGVGLTRTVDIVNIMALAGDEADVFCSFDGGANAGRAHECFSLGMFEAVSLFCGLRHRGHFAGALGDRLDDVVIAGAAADVAFEPVADRRFVEMRALAIDEVDRRHDHAGRAEAALKAVVVLKRLLHRMKLATLREPLDRRDMRTLAACRQRRAALDRLAVDMDDAGPALRRVAADMRAGEPQMIAQKLHEQRPWIDLGRHLPAVYRHRDMNHSQILLNQDFFVGIACGAALAAGGGAAVAGASAPAAAAKLAKNLSAMFLATPSIRREP